MPTLDWIGKQAVVNHHREVPYRLIHCDPELSAGDPETGNLLVQGDNLEALRALLPYYAGKVKCIYIDPPYNTGSEGWVYNDNTNSPEIRKWLGQVVGKEADDLSRHDKWLCMIYPRLRLLREFLSQDGVILVSIDSNELTNLLLVLTEIFGQGNKIAELIWEKGRKNDAKKFSVGHDYIVVFAKSKLFIEDIVWRAPKVGVQEIAERYHAALENYDGDHSLVSADLKAFYTEIDSDHPSKKYSRARNADKWGVWRDNNISWHGGGGPKYPILHPETGLPCKIPEAGWRFVEETMKEKIRDGYVVFRYDHTEPPIYKSYIYRIDGDGDAGQNEVLPSVFYRHTQPSNDTQKSIFGGLIFPNPKDHEVLMRLIDYVVGGNKDAIVLDSFCGSASTGHAVLGLNKRDNGNRRFILVEMEPSIAVDVAAERLRRVIVGYDDEGDPERPIEGIGGGFRFCRLGVPLFDEFGDIAQEVEFPDLAAHIFFSETGVPIPRRATSEYLGMHQGRAVYLLFDAANAQVPREAAGNVLTLDRLAALPPPPEGFEGVRVVYAEGCTVSVDRLKAQGVVFKQIPYQVEGV